MADPLSGGGAKYLWLATLGTAADAVGIEPLSLLWGIIGGFVLQSFRRDEGSTWAVIGKVCASGFVAAAFATPAALWIVSFESLDATHLDSWVRACALVIGGSAQGLFLTTVDGLPSFVRSQMNRWKRGGDA